MPPDREDLGGSGGCGKVVRRAGARRRNRDNDSNRSCVLSIVLMFCRARSRSWHRTPGSAPHWARPYGAVRGFCWLPDAPGRGEGLLIDDLRHWDRDSLVLRPLMVCTV